MQYYHSICNASTYSVLWTWYRLHFSCHFHWRTSQPNVNFYFPGLLLKLSLSGQDSHDPSFQSPALYYLSCSQFCVLLGIKRINTFDSLFPLGLYLPFPSCVIHSIPVRMVCSVIPTMCPWCYKVKPFHYTPGYFGRDNSTSQFFFQNVPFHCFLFSPKPWPLVLIKYVIQLPLSFTPWHPICACVCLLGILLGDPPPPLHVYVVWAL